MKKGSGGTCYIVMDVDWAPDVVLAYAVDRLEELDVEATVFVTHASPLLDRLRSSKRIEIGIHPNFNDLLLGTAPQGHSMRSRVAELRALVPEARVVRSHSLAQSSRLLDVFTEFGFTHDANTLIPASAGMILAAWQHWDGRLVRVPCLFEDSVADLLPAGWSAAPLLEHGGLRVLNFHPIRLYLNAKEVALPPQVESCRTDPEAIAALRRPATAPGSLSLLCEIVSRHRGAGGRFGLVREIQPGAAFAVARAEAAP